MRNKQDVWQGVRWDSSTSDKHTMGSVMNSKDDRLGVPSACVTAQAKAFQHYTAEDLALESAGRGERKAAVLDRHSLITLLQKDPFRPSNRSHSSCNPYCSQANDWVRHGLCNQTSSLKKDWPCHLLSL